MLRDSTGVETQSFPMTGLCVCHGKGCVLKSSDVKAMLKGAKHKIIQEAFASGDPTGE